MQRRSFVAGAAGASFMTSAQAQSKSPSILELRYFRLRNTMDNQKGRVSDFLSNTVVAALQRAGAGAVGLFSSSIGPDTPYILLLVQHANIAAFETCWEKMNADENVLAAARPLNINPALPFERMEVQLLRGFKGFPGVELPSGDAKRPGRIFELRTYESNTPASLAKKIGMFENGEIEIFRKYGLLPVFFGETLVGPKMPNLTYMVAFDNLAAREANWKAFATSPEWGKLRVTPGLSDGETVSNISNVLLTPMPGSQIR
ncbi:MAG: NIPSNAP family protein [Acidobacteria bacterium]|nr:NIPSNAP family protein [Acidobacteriota bacterium]